MYIFKAKRLGIIEEWLQKRKVTFSDDIRSVVNIVLAYAPLQWPTSELTETPTTTTRCLFIHVLICTSRTRVFQFDSTPCRSLLNNDGKSFFEVLERTSAHDAEILIPPWQFYLCSRFFTDSQLAIQIGNYLQNCWPHLRRIYHGILLHTVYFVRLCFSGVFWKQSPVKKTQSHASINSTKPILFMTYF